MLAHALIGYAMARAAGTRLEWLDRSHVTAAMVGALVPDLSKLHLFVSDDPIEAALGTDVELLALHSGGGVLLSVLAVTLLLECTERRRTGWLVAAGAASHLMLDGLLLTETGRTAYAVFWPASTYRPPSPGLYLSGDIWVTALAATVAAVAWWATREARPAG